MFRAGFLLVKTEFCSILLIEKYIDRYVSLNVANFCFVKNNLKNFYNLSKTRQTVIKKKLIFSFVCVILVFKIQSSLSIEKKSILFLIKLFFIHSENSFVFFVQHSIFFKFLKVLVTDNSAFFLFFRKYSKESIYIFTHFFIMEIYIFGSKSDSLELVNQNNYYFFHYKIYI